MFEERGSGGPIVRNKPNLHPQAEIGGAGPTLQAGAIAPNEPNSARPAGEPGPWGETRETKPIPTQTPMAEGRQGRPGHRRDLSCETKPICPLRIGCRAAAGPPSLRPTGSDLRRAKRAKQTQFGPGRQAAGSPESENVRNEANSRLSRMGRALRDMGRGSNVQNKAKLGRPWGIWRDGMRGAYCAKQSQFPSRRYNRQVLSGEGVMVNCTGKGPRRNKAKLGQGRKCGRRRGQACETKPIARSGAPRRCPPRADAMDLEAAIACRPHRSAGVRLVFVGNPPAFVMLREAKHPGGEWNQHLFLCSAQILRWRSEPALSVAEGMTGGTGRPSQDVVTHSAVGGETADFLLIRLRPRVTIISERGLATEFMMEYRRVRRIAM
jgi:hypothetical protein